MKGETAEKLTRDLLLSLFPDGQFESPAGDDHDIVFHADGGLTLVVEVKAMGVPRVEDLIGRLATAVLTLPHAAGRSQLPVATVALDRLGKKSILAAASFMKKHGRGIGWVLLDSRGNYEVDLPGLLKDSMRGKTREAPPSRPRRLFTDLNQWLLKVMLLRDAPPEFFPPASRGMPVNPSELGALAKVSHQTAYNFVHVMEQRGLLSTAHELRIRDVDQLLGDWLHEASRATEERVWVRSVFGLDLNETLDNAGNSDIQLAVGGFAACRELGVLHTSASTAPDIHVLDLALAMKELALARCDRRDADLALVRPRHRQSVFRGTQRLGKVPVVDVIQAALDVASNKARGPEHAEHLFERVRAWQAT